MRTYYNENDPFCAQWLRNLIDANLITGGDVDERSILDVRPDDLKSYTRCHFFAGIAGWDLALKLANFPADREVWTGSCPCQPFSAAGKAGGFADERHLWPYWRHLIAQRRPATLFGEQVASKAGLAWFDLVWTDLEAAGYAVGVSDLGAACIGAPHIRQRLWFVADAQRGTAERWRHDLAGTPRRPESEAWERQRIRDDAGAGEQPCIVAHPDGRNASAERLQRSGQQRFEPQDGRSLLVGDAGSAGLQERERNGSIQREALGAYQRQAAIGRSDLGSMALASGTECGSGRPGWRREDSSGSHAEFTRSSPWRDCDWLPCTDGKARPVEPGTFPLAHGIPGRVGRLRAYGNAIVPQVAAEFIEVAMHHAP